MKRIGLPWCDSIRTMTIYINYGANLEILFNSAKRLQVILYSEWNLYMIDFQVTH